MVVTGGADHIGPTPVSFWCRFKVIMADNICSDCRETINARIVSQRSSPIRLRLLISETVMQGPVRPYLAQAKQKPLRL